MQCIVLLLCYIAVVCSWKLPFNRFATIRSQAVCSSERRSRLYSQEAVVSDQLSIPGVESLSEDTAKEEVFTAYPFGNLSLPVLLGCNDYKSGRHGSYFWYQNRDHVYAFLPIDDSVSKSEVSVIFEPFNVTVSIGGELLTRLFCPYALSPSGSFWIIEQDKNDQRYIMLDLEKRVGYINWASLFVPKRPSAVDSSAVVDPNKSALLEKLLAANEGLSKLGGGGRPQSIEDMLSDPELMETLSTESELNEGPLLELDGDKVKLLSHNETTAE